MFTFPVFAKLKVEVNHWFSLQYQLLVTDFTGISEAEKNGKGLRQVMANSLATGYFNPQRKVFIFKINEALKKLCGMKIGASLKWTLWSYGDIQISGNSVTNKL